MSLSVSLGVLDMPNNARKIHKKPTPKTGSYSVAIIIFISILADFIFNLFENDFKYLLISSLLIFIVGFFDDKYNLKARNKVFFIVLISLILCIFSNNFVIFKFYIHTFDFFFNLNQFSLLFTVLCIFTLVNSLNLADGINGLAIGLVFSWLIYINLIYENNLDIIIYSVLISLSLSFFHNIKGNHFLGDAGSLMLSSFVAFLLIYLYNQNIGVPNNKNNAENILILFLIPVIDMVRLFFERLINKKSPSTADKNHLHHYLAQKFSENKSLIIYLISVNIPIFISINSHINKIYIIISVIFLYSAFIFYYKYSKKNNQNL